MTSKTLKLFVFFGTSLKENEIAWKFNEHSLLSLGSLQLILCYDAQEYGMVNVSLYIALNNIL